MTKTPIEKPDLIPAPADVAAFATLSPADFTPSDVLAATFLAADTTGAPPGTMMFARLNGVLMASAAADLTTDAPLSIARRAHEKTLMGF